MTAPCYRCPRLSVSLDERRSYRVHYATNDGIRPCGASWRKAREPTYPFSALDEVEPAEVVTS